MMRVLLATLCLALLALVAWAELRADENEAIPDGAPIATLLDDAGVHEIGPSLEYLWSGEEPVEWSWGLDDCHKPGCKKSKCNTGWPKLYIRYETLLLARHADT